MISSSVSEILERLREEKIRSVSSGPAISVNKLTSRAGAMYEKIRYLVDYKDEHTIRRSAIERMLVRKFSREGEKNIGMPLLTELVSAEYLPNNHVPETVAEDIQGIVDKYWILCAKMEKRWTRKQEKKLSNAEESFLSLAASEIDRMLFPHELDDAAVESFYKTMKETVRWEPEIAEENFRAPLYIACRRTLLGDDPQTLLYVLVSKYVPRLEQVKDIEEITSLAAAFSAALSRARRDIGNPLVWRVSAAIRNRAVGFSIIKEIIKNHGADAEYVFESSERLESETKKILAEKYVKQNHSVWVSGVHAAVYILLTKSIFTFLLEVPYEWYWHDSVDIFALSVNIIFHPILLLLMVYTIQPLDSKNMSRTLSIVKSIVQNSGNSGFAGEKKGIYVRTPRRRPVMALVLGVLYLVLFAATFGAIIRALLWLKFSFVSIALFLFFLALVSYFGLRIRHNARKWKISLPNESTASLLWNFFTIPIIRVGRWLSQKFASLNIFVFVMDFIIETPFKIMLGTFDSFLSFLREKEEDMY